MVSFILLFLYLVFEENRSRNIVKQVVQEWLKAEADLQCVSISIPVFVFIKEHINDLLGGLLEAISSFDLKELNIIKIVSDQNTVVHLNHIIEHCKDILSNRQYQTKV